MCGIAGIINHHADPDAGKIIRAMTRSMTHRGPDGGGLLVNEEIAFGHRRLAIIDPAGGAQPISSEDGDVTVILNGEIYNYRKLRGDLEARGHKFKTDTDTEVIVHLYEELGGECVAMLDGMFAFAAYNRRTHRVLLARDRFGKKPLLYFMTGDTLVFASEFEALREHPAMPRELDYNSVSDYLSLLYVPSPNTIYRNVRKLPPAHQLELRFNDGTLSIRGYWHIDYSLKENIPFEEAVRELRRLTERSVEKRLMSDVPIGTFLSGGLDSAIITAVAAKLRGDAPTDAFTIGFDERTYDERQSAARSAARITELCDGRLRHHIQVVDPCDFGLLEKLAARFGEPFADASMLPTYLLSRFAREKITVALSGDGADEVFAGYERYLAVRYANRTDLLPGFLRRPVFGLMAGAFPANGERTLSGRLRRFCRSCAAETDRRYFHLLDRCPHPLKQTLFGERLANAAHRNSAEWFESIEWELTSPHRIERLAELDLNTYLVNDILPKVDIASMASSLEVRTPFLDRELVEFAAKLPIGYKLHGRSRKHILKRAFADLLPSEVLNRPKRGFGVPVGDWLRGEWRYLAEEAIFDGRLLQDGYFREKPLRTLWTSHQEERCDNSYLLWPLLIFSLFLNNN